jgi:murein DD-endopeptidase MepM/ murein hydrolase activator NlpD
MKAIIDYPITSDWQEIDNMHPIIGHTGIDIATPLNTKIISQDSGIITLTTDKWLGNAVRLKIDGSNETIVYGHINEFKVYNGQHAKENTLLALTGGDPKMPNQGYTNGPHVHVTLISSTGQIVSPYNYLFNHESASNNSSPFLFPVMLVLILFVLWKIKKFVAYGLVATIGLIVIFIVS